ncbi:MAG: CopG family ribbon-helix-helix protein [Leptolyngbyaceae cyanobacterium]
MANSPLISLRIPPDTLERIDQLAQKRYPARRSGKKPNRSQVILDAIEQFLDQADLQDSAPPSTNTVRLSRSDNSNGSTVVSNVTASTPNYAVIQTLGPEKRGEITNSEVLTNYQPVWAETTDGVDQNTSASKTSSTRKYIDLWLDYFSYMGKLAKPWFISRM